MLKIPAPCRRLQTVYYQLHFFNPAHQKAMRTFAQNRVEFERSKEAYLWGVNPIKMFSKNTRSHHEDSHEPRNPSRGGWERWRRAGAFQFYSPAVHSAACPVARKGHGKVETLDIRYSAFDVPRLTRVFPILLCCYRIS